MTKLPAGGLGAVRSAAVTAASRDDGGPPGLTSDDRQRIAVTIEAEVA